MKGCFLAIIIIATVFFAACSRKQHPASEPTAVNTSSTNNSKPAAKKTIKRILPKVITVDDRAATKTPDGRLYYDLNGKRYWRNYVDGKYYLFNKNMYNDPAFKPR